MSGSAHGPRAERCWQQPQGGPCSSRPWGAYQRLTGRGLMIDRCIRMLCACVAEVLRALPSMQCPSCRQSSISWCTLESF